MPILPLKDIPEDIRKIVLRQQMEIKIEKKVGKFSQALVVYSIIREWEKMKQAIR